MKHAQYMYVYCFSYASIALYMSAFTHHTHTSHTHIDSLSLTGMAPWPNPFINTTGPNPCSAGRCANCVAN